MFKNRSVVEIMVLAFTFTVALAIAALGASIVLVQIRNPGADTDSASTVLFNLISGMMGALLGLLAGKSTDTNPPHLEPPPPYSHPDPDTDPDHE